MVDVTETSLVDGSADAVWNILADFGGLARWAPNVDHSSLTTEMPDGIGAVRRVQVGRNTLLERIVEWEPGVRLAYEIEGLPPVIRSVTNIWSLDESASSTAVAITSRIVTGPRPPHKAAARVFGKVLAKASRQMLDGLKAEVEGNSP